MEVRLGFAVRTLTVCACLVSALAGCTEPGGNSDVAALKTRVEKIEGLLPGPGEAMSGIQVHFAKLHFAGEAGNWDLARFELAEIKENLDLVVTLRPEDNGVDLKGLADAFERTQLAGVAGAIEAGDPARFDRLYAESIAMCNACHERTGRPFIVITSPTSPPVPNQQWRPAASSVKE
jgi:hypothetical protein